MEATIHTSSNQKPKIAIIGAGPTGLLSCRHLKDIADVTVFEAKSTVGGIWNYSDITTDNHPNLAQDPFFQLYGNLHSSLYADLVCNLPRHCMTYKDFPHKKNMPYVLNSKQFLQYLNDYSDHFKLRGWVEFETLVISVNLTKNVSNTEIENLGLNSEEPRKFIVTTMRMDKPEAKKHRFYDYVIVCNGHYSKPFIPKIPGQEEFEGKQIHTHDVRTIDPELFHKKNVLILGTNISANDQIHLLLGERARDQKVEVNKIFITGTNMKFLPNSTEFAPWMKAGKLVLKGAEAKPMPPVQSESSRSGSWLSRWFGRGGYQHVPNEESKEAPSSNSFFSCCSRRRKGTNANPSAGIEKSQNPPVTPQASTPKEGVKCLGKGFEVTFNDGTTETVHTIIYATGYLHSLPFLTNTSDNIIEFPKDDPGFYFGPLYMRTFAIKEPSLIFIGLCSRIIPVHPTYERQVMLVKQGIEGKVKLPSQSQMLAELEEELKKYDASSYGRKGYYLFGSNYTATQFNQDMLKMNTLEEDESYQVITPIEETLINCFLAGNIGHLKTLNYGQFLDGVPYFPTSSKF